MAETDIVQEAGIAVKPAPRKGCSNTMRIHKDGFLQCRQMKVWIPRTSYNRALSTGMYRSEGLENEIEQHLDVVVSGPLQFRMIEDDGRMVRIQIDSDWIQPTRT